MGVALPKPVVTRIYERNGAPNWRVGSCSVNGYRDNMEDAELIFLNDKWAFFAVFDGHAGDKCSAYLHQEWERRLMEEPFPISDKRLQDLALEIDLKYMQIGDGSGSTGTFFIAEIKDETATREATVHLQVGNVGDSRVLACKNGAPMSLTTDHKPNDPLEKTRIMESGGIVQMNRVDGSLAVSRAFGDAEYKQGTGDQVHQKVIALPEVTHCTLTIGSTSDDFAVLACDGVFEGNFSNDQVVEFVKAQLLQNQDLAVVSGNVCDEAIARGSKDNITCMVVQFKNGKDFAGMGLDCAAGPWTNPDHNGFRKNYHAMAIRGNLTIGECLMQRYDFLNKKGATARSEEEENEWRNNFPQGGPPEGTAERAQWFSNYFENLGQKGGGGVRHDMLDLAPRQQQAQQQQQGPSLVELMQQNGKTGGSEGGGDQPQ